MLTTQKVVVFEESVGAKLVNNYRQLPTIRMPASHAGGIKTDAGEQAGKKKGKSAEPDLTS